MRVSTKHILMESSYLLEADIAEKIAGNLSEEGINRIKQAIANLPEGARNVVQCVLVQDMKYKEAAAELGVTINTIKTQLKREMLKLREELKDKEELLYLFFIVEIKYILIHVLSPLYILITSFDSLHQSISLDFKSRLAKFNYQKPNLRRMHLHLINSEHEVNRFIYTYPFTGVKKPSPIPYRSCSPRPMEVMTRAVKIN